MSTIHAGADSSEKVKKANGMKATRVRAVEPDDDAFDRKRAKTVVALEDGTELVLENHEIID